MEWVNVRGKKRPSIEFLKTRQKIDTVDAIDGWELKLDSPQYSMRYWLGCYYCFTTKQFIDAVSVEYLTKDQSWVQVDYYERNDYA